MHELRTGLALFLLLNILAGMVRVVRGPTLTDRFIVAQLFGTTGVGVLVLLAGNEGSAPLRDVALIFALLAPVTVVAFVRFAVGSDAEDARARGEEPRR
ncbi:monovalent cation/H+ antiporter complex subunit F [Myxococcus faecalis]|jgi:multicomponent Na+:H+ antiporter subunit F|uniref:monovalent cation/H+ antiporter complex subunit F n=1 Tax=Myxococcus TaxID=32 RepID=UPI001CBBCD8F|nr:MULTISPECIES: monovalent cation/H+ antiporter complex subunit F [unclassified Myxococcus]MBZ4394148.1 pH regulation protein F [Myxococcus sp. AS-1-15]MBZ4413775.1 pH regulation protein F [Myxococcus sp. XM-1-1-1]BDT37317.1 monovalent cation/H antiporter complex subunit F [Myxococcus sp. MH1]